MNLIANQFFFKIYSRLFANKVGSDDYGNMYYKKSNTSPINNFRERRWVIYKGDVEASKVPQRWNAWLHHVTDDVPKKIRIFSWIKNHKINEKKKVDLNNLNKEKRLDKAYKSWNPND